MRAFLRNSAKNPRRWNSLPLPLVLFPERDSGAVKVVLICIDFFDSDDINMATSGDKSRPPCTWVFTAWFLKRISR